jgi:superfamily II DNA or RNA helicase
MELRPRDYQEAAVVAVEQAWATGTDRTAVVMPTGAGKTIVLARLARRWLERQPGSRVLVLAHREELVAQAVSKIRAVAPNLRVGVVMAGRDQVGADVVVASVATASRPARLARLRGIGLCIVDECHHATAESYLRILEHTGAWREDAGKASSVAVGFTATLSRGDGVGLGAVWQNVAYRVPISYLIKRGWLVSPRGIAVHVEDLDLADVKRSRGDLQPGALGEALDASMAPKRIVEAWLEHASTRLTVAFVPTVAFAQTLTEAFCEAGVAAQCVWGEMDPTERRRVLAEFAAGRVRVVVNCMVLTEGTDIPPADCAIIARPTTHRGLYVQMAGRVLRPAPGKDDALILDVVGAARRHALRAEIDLVGLADLTRTAEADAMLDGELGDEDDELVVLDGPASLAQADQDGRLVAQEVDLFHGSRWAWNTTRAGAWFLSTDSRYLVIIPGLESGTYDIATVGRRVGSGSAWVTRAVPDLGYAMGYAEECIEPVEMTLAGRDRGWRSRPVSDKARRLAERLRLPVNAGSRAGEVSQMIDRVFASDRIDPGLRGQ